MDDRSHEQDAEQPGEGKPSKRPPDRLTVLLADADTNFRWMVAAALRREGHRVIELGDGNGLVKAIQVAFGAERSAAPGTIVVTEVDLPGAGGLNVLRELRARRRRPPFILMGTAVDGHVQEDARNLGALAVFAKPFDVDDLRVAVKAAASVLPRWYGG